VLKNRYTFNTFIGNVKKYIKQNGVFIFTTLDGDMLTKTL